MSVSSVSDQISCINPIQSLCHAILFTIPYYMYTYGCAPTHTRTHAILCAHNARDTLRVRKLCVNVGRTKSKQSNFIPLTHCCAVTIKHTIDYKCLRALKIAFTHFIGRHRSPECGRSKKCLFNFCSDLARVSLSAEMNYLGRNHKWSGDYSQLLATSRMKSTILPAVKSTATHLL